MSKAAEIVARANACLGLTRIQLGILGYHAWCAHFVSEVLRYVGIDMYDLSCTRMQAKMDDSKDWDEPDDLHPIPGDILFFDWDHKPEELPLDHVGIVTGYSNGTITYVNGNGNDSNRVTRQTMSIKNTSIEYWMRYAGDEKVEPIPDPDPIPTPKTIKKCTVELEELSYGCKSPSVETMQNLLADVGIELDVDGNFGPDTERALKEFQKRYKLTVDGICGPKTWKALIEAI